MTSRRFDLLHRVKPEKQVTSTHCLQDFSHHQPCTSKETANKECKTAGGRGNASSCSYSLLILSRGVGGPANPPRAGRKAVTTERQRRPPWLSFQTSAAVTLTQHLVSR